MAVAIAWDDLRVGVIVLSNLMIAGSLRNIYQYIKLVCFDQVGANRRMGQC